MVTCLSGYVNRERLFLNCLVEHLGGTAQEVFAKKDNKAKRSLASTHLVCPEPDGQKYNAALKWSLPAVTKAWLAACLKDCTWVSERPFLVGDSEAVTEGKPLPRVREEVTDEDDTMTTDETRLPADDTMETDHTRCAMEVEEVGMNGDMSNEEIVFAGAEAVSDPSTPLGSRTAKLGVDTPGPRLDTPSMERLRPKPIDVNNITVTPQRFPDSQPSPGSQVVRERAGSDEREGRSEG